jgi:transcriptional regulator with XRE-family HTH domain
MDFHRLGATFRAVRIKKRWRQVDVASRASASRDAVSRLERGHGRGLTLDSLLCIAEALDMSVRFNATWRGGELDRLLNARHSALHESLASWLSAREGWELAPEVSFSVFGERGVIDILALHVATKTLLVIELKTEVVDVNELMARVDVKQRLAVEVARKRGWHARHVAAWVVVAEGSTNRRRVAAHANTLRAAFPSGARQIGRWIAAPSGEIRALSFWSDVRTDGSRLDFAIVKRVRRGPTKSPRT